MEFDFQKNTEKNSIDKMVSSDMGVDLKQEAYEAITSVKNVYVVLENLTKNAQKNAQNLAKKKQKQALDNLKTSLELELVTEKEYYENLKKYRDENLRQGTDEWYKATKEIAAYNKRLADEAKKAEMKFLEEVSDARRKAVQEEADRQIAIMTEVFNMEKELGEKLGGEKGEWYLSQKITFHGMAQNGGDIVYRKKALEDFEKEIKLLEKYKESVLALEKLGNIPDGVFSEIAAMDTDEALVAMDVLLSVDDAKRQKFIDGYNNKNSLTEKTAAELNPILNKEYLESLGIESAESFNKGFFELGTSDKAKFIKLLEESFENIPEQYYKLGTTAGQRFGESFQEEFGLIMKNTKESALVLASEVASEINFLFEKAENVNNVSSSNVYNTTYSFNAAKETVREQLDAAKNNALLKKLRGGN